MSARVSIAIAALSLVVVVVACKRSAIERERAAAEKARDEAEAQEKAKLAAMEAGTMQAGDDENDAAPPVDFSSLPTKIVAIAADPESFARDPRGTLDDGVLWATIEFPGCVAPSFSWNPKKKDVWGFRNQCPGLKPADLAPPGGIDAIDESYMVITAGPLAGVLADRNLIDPDIWTIATVGWRMRNDASMFVFCANGRVPGRTFMSDDTFRDRCTKLMETRVGMPSSKFDPTESNSGYDCSRTWKVEATFEKELFDENKITRKFLCTYDAAKPSVKLDVWK
jgi:hypothetical protein